MNHHRDFKLLKNERKIVESFRSNSHTDEEIKNVINVVCNINNMELNDDKNLGYIKDQVGKYLECKPLKDVVNTLGNFNFV